MPQFDFSTFPSQIFWLFVFFTIAFVLFSRFVIPKVDEALSERQQRVDDDLAKAAELKAETEAAIEAYEKALAEARAKAHGILKDAQEAMAKDAEARNQEVSDRLAKEIKAGEDRIAKAKTQALKEVSGIAAEAAQAVAEKVAGVKATKADLDKVVGAVMKERG